MILSVSRRTDIPNYYTEWFFNRIREGYAYVRNPMNPHQVSKISISPDVVDCIVFWTKNPQPMMERLDELSAYQYYFQFTLTGYGKDMERNLPHKKEKMIPVFRKLSKQIGSQKVIWRYDPIIFTKTYTPEYHLRAFEQIADSLQGYTKKCVISFVDVYAKNRKAMTSMEAYEPDADSLRSFSETLGKIARENGMTVASCGEQIDLSVAGIEHNCCIDKQLIEEITGCEMNAGKDKNQRPECGCIESIDIGAYNTCPNNCRYCYANYSPGSVAENCRKYDPAAPLLCGTLTEEDKISERRVKSLKEEQLRIKWS